MKNLRSKMKKQGGFTLIEMLIVVAIIAILVAVSIPVVNNALERTRNATDAANERAAKAAVMVAYLSEAKIGGVEFTPGSIYIYDAVNGKLVNTPLAGYGKCSEHKGLYIYVKYNEATDEVFLDWSNSGTAPTELNGNGANIHGIKVDE